RRCRVGASETQMRIPRRECRLRSDGPSDQAADTRGKREHGEFLRKPCVLYRYLLARAPTRKRQRSMLRATGSRMASLLPLDVRSASMAWGRVSPNLCVFYRRVRIARYGRPLSSTFTKNLAC